MTEEGWVSFAEEMLSVITGILQLSDVCYLVIQCLGKPYKSPMIRQPAGSPGIGTREGKKEQRGDVRGKEAGR